MTDTRNNQVGRAVSLVVLASLLSFAVVRPASAQIISSPTSVWYTPTKNGNALQDPNNDQQTGSGGAGGEADLVSSQGTNYTVPLLYTGFDRGSLASPTDGTFYFRVRLGEAGNQGSFDRAVFVYLFADAGDSIDLVVGVNQAGSADRIGVWRPGAGLNISPNTTSISQPPAPYTYATANASNYNVSLVSSAIQPGVPSTDIDADGNNDIFVSFAVPFADIVTQIQAVRGISVDETTSFRYVLATATQENSLNQDIGGIGNYTNSQGNSTYTDLGVVTDPFSPTNVAFNLPEPGTLAFGVLGLALVGGVFARRRR